MLRKSLLGALAFGLSAAAAGYLWTALEFPFALIAAGIVGWMVVTWGPYGPKKAGMAAAVGGVSFTAAFLVGIFFAITDGSPFALPAWLAAALAAAIAGAITGAVLEGRRGALVLASFSAAGMFAGEVLAGILRAFAPASVDVEGPLQYAYFALAIGLVGLATGAAIGAGIARLTGHRHEGTSGETLPTGPPHAVA